MSALEEHVQAEPIEETTAPGGQSLRDRIAAQERQIEQEPEHAIIVPLSWLDGVAVQYRAMSQREAFKIEERHEKSKNKDEYQKNLLAVVDKMINACERLVEQTGPDEYLDTGFRWSDGKVARDLFGRSLPENATSREGVLAVFPDEEIIFEHFAEYEEQRRAIRTKLASRVEGESGASSVRT